MFECYLKKYGDDYYRIFLTTDLKGRLIDIEMGFASDPFAIRFSDMISSFNPIDFVDLVAGTGYLKKCYSFEGKPFKTLFLNPSTRKNYRKETWTSGDFKVSLIHMVANQRRMGSSH